MAGDPIAAPMLISILGDRLLGFAHSEAPGLSDTDREQIVELAVEAGVRSIHSFDPDRGTLFSWFRQQVRYQTRQWFRNHPACAAMPDDVEEPSTIEFSWMDDEIVRNGLAKAIAQLSGDDQLILALRSAERMAFSEIGLRLGIKEPAARQRHKRALGRLRVIANKDKELTSRFAASKEEITT